MTQPNGIFKIGRKSDKKTLFKITKKIMSQYWKLKSERSFSNSAPANGVIIHLPKKTIIITIKKKIIIIAHNFPRRIIIRRASRSPNVQNPFCVLFSLGPNHKTLKTQKKWSAKPQNPSRNGGHPNRRGRIQQRYRGSSGPYRRSPGTGIRCYLRRVGPSRLRPSVSFH